MLQGMKEECMQSPETKVALKRKLEVKTEVRRDNWEANPRSGKKARIRDQPELSKEQREKLVFLSSCLQVWMSPSVDDAEEDLVREMLLDDRHSGRALTIRLDFQFQAFSNFAMYLLGGNTFQEASQLTKMRCFQSALLLRYAVHYNQASQMFESCEQWSYDKTTLKLVGIENETAIRFFKSALKLSLDSTEVGLLTALIILTNHTTGYQENALCQEEVYSDLLTVYEDQRQEEKRAGVRLGLVLDLLNQLAGLPRVETNPSQTTMAKAPGAA